MFILCTPCIFVVYAGSHWLTTVLSLSILQLTYQSEWSSGVCVGVWEVLFHELEHVTTAACPSECVFLLHELLLCFTFTWINAAWKYDGHTQHMHVNANHSKPTSSLLRTQTWSSHRPERKHKQEGRLFIFCSIGFLCIFVKVSSPDCLKLFFGHWTLLDSFLAQYFKFVHKPNLWMNDQSFTKKHRKAHLTNQSFYT